MKNKQIQRGSIGRLKSKKNTRNASPLQKSDFAEIMIPLLVVSLESFAEQKDGKLKEMFIIFHKLICMKEIDIYITVFWR